MIQFAGPLKTPVRTRAHHFPQKIADNPVKLVKNAVKIHGRAPFQSSL